MSLEDTEVVGRTGGNLYLKEPPYRGICSQTQKSNAGWIVAHFHGSASRGCRSACRGKRHMSWLYVISRIFVALDFGVRARAQEQPPGSLGLVQLKECQSLSLGWGWRWEVCSPFMEEASSSKISTGDQIQTEETLPSQKNFLYNPPRQLTYRT